GSSCLLYSTHSAPTYTLALSLHDALPISADNAHGLLLLTATPLQLDPNEYYLLLSLVDPVIPETYEEFEARLERQGDLSERLRKDRKSTRLNSSHVKISYAVFCLKKKKKN